MDMTPDRTITLTLDEARRLPDMLGRIAPHMLKAHGRYTATVGGLKTLYLLASAQPARDVVR